MQLSSYLRAALVVAGLGLAGCGSNPVASTNIIPASAVISNTSGKTVASVRYQPCGGAAGEFTPLAIGAIGSGQSVNFELPGDCVNMEAYYADGRRAGQQSGIRRDFPFTWEIR